MERKATYGKGVSSFILISLIQSTNPIHRSSTSSVFHATVALPPGTHHIRFLVDDQWRVADYLPTAVDDQGSLANYVDVPVSYSPPNPSAAVPRAPPSSTPSPPKYQPQPPQTRKLLPGQSFWSAASSTDDESHADQHHHYQGPSSPQTRHGHGIWTTVLPPELIEAAREEEAYLNASAAETSTHTRGGTTYVNGFVPAPNIPPAPGLPRHLDKLILNSRVTPSTTSGSGSARGSVVGAPTGSGAGGKKHGSGVGAMGSGNSVGRKQRDRERKERERERDKQERRKRSGGGGIPPAPPPSEVGDTSVDVGAATSPDMTPETPTPTGDSSIPTSPVISTPPTSPVPSNTPPVVVGATGHGHGPNVPVLNLPLGASAATPTASATYSHGLSNTPTPTLSLPSHISASAPSPTPPSTRPLTVGLGLDNEPALADDASVLPVPSHVVLHHLCTSAIRNGVLAVGNTTRYRKKYLTTIYYKPT